MKVSLQANISNKPFDQKTPGHPEVGVLNCQRPRDRQTDAHRNSMTESAQWANSVKIWQFLDLAGLAWLLSSIGEGLVPLVL